MKRFFFLIVILVILVGLGYIFWQKKHSNPNLLIEPLSTQSAATAFPNKNDKPKVVLGFLPYWLGEKASFQPELTDWAYFSLVLESDGSFVIRQSPGYSFYSKQFSSLYETATQQNIKTHLTVAQFDEDKVIEFLQSPSAQRQFFVSLTTVMSNTPIQGINIDFEITSEITPELQQEFSQFIERLDQWRDQYYPQLLLTTDVYPSSIERLALWDIPTISSHLDYIVIMTYDFHRASSSTAGPISPLLNTAEQQSEKNIVYYLSRFVETIPPEKILLGIPFYGYEWETTDTFPRSLTFPRTGATASLERIQTLLTDPQLSPQYFWEDSTLSPYLSLERNGKNYVISFENPQSLKYKLHLVNETGLAGIAIWALGYEGTDRAMWDVINREL